LRKTRLPTVPQLVACPECGLPIERGGNPKGVAWHDCRFVEDGLGTVTVTAAQVEQLALKRLRAHAAALDTNAKDLVTILAELRKRGDVRTESSGAVDEDDVVTWLNSGSARKQA
jgi:hypothetical protein